MAGSLFLDRGIVPRWRSPNASLRYGEFSLSGNSPNKHLGRAIEQFKLDKKMWSQGKSLHVATDLLSNASVLGVEEDQVDLAEYVYQRKEQCESAIIRLAERILNPNVEIHEVLPTSILEEIQNGTNRFQNNIAQIREHLKQEPKNAIAWMELARNFSSIGRIDKALKATETALYIEGSNRYIVRSASRFFVHVGDLDRAAKIIRNSLQHSTDPWLLSAEIACSLHLRRNSRFLKTGLKLVDEEKYSPFDLSELSISLATFEGLHGNYKAGRKLFIQSLKDPSENAKAQAIWLKNRITDTSFINVDVEVPCSFEADAYDHYLKKEYGKSFEKSIRWFHDEPYSTRALINASHIAYTFLKQDETSLLLLEHGNVLKPDDRMVLNNLAYQHARANDIASALKYFNQINLNSGVTEIEKITLTATAGLINYKLGNRMEGKNLYLSSIHEASKLRNSYFEGLATVNYVNVETDYAESKTELSELKRLLIAKCKDIKADDVLLLCKEAEQKIDMMIQNPELL